MPTNKTSKRKRKSQSIIDLSTGSKPELIPVGRTIMDFIIDHVLKDPKILLTGIPIIFFALAIVSGSLTSYKVFLLVLLAVIFSWFCVCCIKKWIHGEKE